MKGKISNSGGNKEIYTSLHIHSKDINFHNGNSMFRIDYNLSSRYFLDIRPRGVIFLPDKTFYPTSQFQEKKSFFG